MLILLPYLTLTLTSVIVSEYFPEIYNATDEFLGQRSVLDARFSDIYYPPTLPTFCSSKEFASNSTRGELFVMPGEAPSNFCTWSPYRKPGLFNQFMLESVMLRSWVKSTWTPASGADVVVVPSYLHHYVWTFQATKRWDDIMTVCSDKDKLREYWRTVQAKYHKPEEGYMPWIITHYSYAWDAWNRYFLLTLAEQPKQFVERVIIMSLDGSNLPLNTKIAMHRLCPKASPTLLSLPYTTGVLRTADWMKPDARSHYAGASKIRPFHILFDGTWKNMRRYSSIRKWIRRVGKSMHDSHQTRQAKFRTLLVPKIEFPDRVRQNYIISHYRLWEVAVNSDFCLEPDGDTPTRSHLFVAVQAGCIPVIFDHASDGNYSATLPTEWPFRFTEEPYRLDYTKFAMVYDSNKVLSGEIDVFKELIDMPTKQPERFASLRRELVKASKWLTYTFPEVMAGNKEKADTRMKLFDPDYDPDACPIPGVCDTFSAMQGALSAVVVPL
jgi:hypothetical protein